MIEGDAAEIHGEAGSLQELGTIEPSRDMGRSIRMRDGLLAVGAPGRLAGTGGVYIYVYSLDLGWVLQALGVSAGGQFGARLGEAVDCGDGLVFAGETIQALPPADVVRGKVHVFDQAQGWARVQVLAPVDAEGGDRFGFAVATDGALAVTGAPGKDGARGAAYVFERIGGAWMQAAKLVIAEVRGPGDFFGAAVAVEGERVLVGAHGRDAQAGAAYVFERVADKWAQVQGLRVCHGGPGDRRRVARPVGARLATSATIGLSSRRRGDDADDVLRAWPVACDPRLTCCCASDAGRGGWHGAWPACTCSLPVQRSSSPDRTTSLLIRTTLRSWGT